MPSRSGFVALVGAPNVGKSTLFNCLIGSELSIVTPKPQTTRLRIRGIVLHQTKTGDLSEIILADSPGIFAPRRSLDRMMVEAAWSATDDADAVLFVVDAARPFDSGSDALATRLARLSKPILLLINKIDLVARPKLLPLIARLAKLAPFAETFLVSAVRGEGKDALLDALASLMPQGPHLYPEQQISDLPERVLSSEFVRQQVFLQTRGEVPYDANVETTAWEEHRDGSVRIAAVILVARASQKAILIGAAGTRIRDIGARARTRLSAALGRPVHLVLRVEVAPHWADDARYLRSCGQGAAS